MILPLDDQLPDLRLPHKQEEDEESVQAVEDVREVGVVLVQIDGVGEHLRQPRDAHHDEEPDVQAEPNQFRSFRGRTRQCVCMQYKIRLV